jgi:transposase
MRGHGQKLSANFDKAIDALLTTASLKDAAAKVGVHIQTLQRWLMDDAFNRVYTEAKQAMTKHARGHLMQSQIESVLVLRQVQMDRQASAGARVQAARTILELSRDHADYDALELRISDLQREVEVLRNGYDPASISRNGHGPGNGPQRPANGASISPSP